MARRWITACLGLLALGCTSQSRPTPETERRDDDPAKTEMQMATPLPIGMAAERARRTTWAKVRDTCVIVQGYASGGTKTDPELGMGPAHPAGDIDVDLEAGDETWLKLEPGSLVEVRGTVVDRHDLRVVVPSPEERAREGLPMPTEVEIDAARTHYVIEHATVRALRTPAQIEADLEGLLEETVELPGILWSRNGHWWFDYEGIDVHLEELENIEGWGGPDDLHGRPMTVVGRLDRSPMPRVDQIGLKNDRDLAEAFVVQVERSRPYPIRPIRPCEP